MISKVIFNADYFGIYFLVAKDLLSTIDNLSLNKREMKKSNQSTVTGGGFFKLAITNILLVIFTLRLGYAWVVTRTMNYIFDNIEMEEISI
jgi:uncharacterized membrane protein YjgN (DUF898 family)